VLDDLRGEKDALLEEARYYIELGDSYFYRNQYREAVKYYQRAFEIEPLINDAARKRYNDALNILEERVGEVPSVADAIVEEKRVLDQQTRVELELSLGKARTALETNDMEEAERQASMAVDLAHLLPDLDAARRKEAEALLEQVRREKRLKAAREKQAMLRDAREQAERDLQEEAQIRYRTVQTLLRKAMDQIRLKDYTKTIEICERVIEIDPDNRVAKFWLADAKDQVIKQRRLKLIQDKIENDKLAEEAFTEAAIPYNDIFVFPDEDEWDVIRKRGESLTTFSVEDPEPIRRIKNALEGTTVDFRFDDTALSAVVQQLFTFTGARIMVDPQVDDSLTVNMSLQGVSAMNALNLILESLDLTYTFRENVLFITNPGQQSGATEFAIYNVSDLLNKIRDFEGPELMLKPQGAQDSAPISFVGGFDAVDEELDPDQLMQLVIESTGGDELWMDPNSIEYHQGQFLVNAPRDLHGQVQNVLSNLRKDSDLFVVIEARFIDVTDDFLEDIGIDSRALGLGNNIGIPFGQVINDFRTGGQDIGFTEDIPGRGDPELVRGLDRWAGRVQHIIDGFTGTIRGDRLNAAEIGGLTVQGTWLEPFQINVILRAVQERSDVKQLTAPVVTAHNGQRVYVSVITQRAYIADYNLVSGGTGFAIIEVADPEVETFQEGVILDVDPVISHDKKYITLDVKPTLATLLGGIISTVLISLGSFTNVAFQVPIGVPEISLQQSFTSVTVPNGGTVLLGGFKSLNEAKFTSYIPILGKIPIIENLFRRKATISEKRSLVILITARIVDLRGEEARKFNPE
jgi:type II secretory pathway component GspD/PulD (secretin)